MEFSYEQQSTAEPWDLLCDGFGCFIGRLLDVFVSSFIASALIQQVALSRLKSWHERGSNASFIIQSGFTPHSAKLPYPTCKRLESHTLFHVSATANQAIKLSISHLREYHDGFANVQDFDPPLDPASQLVKLESTHKLITRRKPS